MRGPRNFQIDPDEILLDATNLPEFNTQQFEGRIEKALSRRAILFLSIGFILIGLGYLYRLGMLQIVHGKEYRIRSEDNSLRLVTVPPERGGIYDRNGELLAWNDPVGGRRYKDSAGLSHVLGYLGLPTREELDDSLVKDPALKVGKMGVERQYDELLRGTIGQKVEEIDSMGNSVSEGIHVTPVAGQAITLSIDNRLQGALYQYIEEIAAERNFKGGAGLLMDVLNGEVIALVSFPEFSLATLSATNTKKEVLNLLSDKRTPFLNRAVSGVYTPGSVIKPFVALGALSEGTIDPDKEILSTGSIEIPNPYVPGVVSIFKDWKAHGFVDMRRALAVSSNVYFYEIGGGYMDQKGLGIENIYKYARLFGFGSETGIDLAGEQYGTVPNSEWKKTVFDEPWRLGDTYHTAIGQYGFQVTPIQMLRAVSAIANGGKLLTPHILKDYAVNYPGVSLDEIIPISESNFQIVREGMRLGVLEGTATAISAGYVKFAGKTGTAELGEEKKRVNSWIDGYFPYQEPRYAFVVVMENGRAGNTIGASAVAKRFFDWMSIYTPEYYNLD